MGRKVKEVILLLEINGWYLDRIRGDHRIFRKIGAKRPITVSGNNNKDMPEGLYRAILREANLK